MKKITVFTMILALTFLVPQMHVHSAELGGITMPDSIQVSGKSLSLVGQGQRKVLVVNVYVSGLYMENPSNDPEEVINSDQIKRLVLQWKYKEVKTDKLKKEYREKLEENTPERSNELNEKINKFISFFTKNAVKGDQFVYTYVPGTGTTVFLSGEEKGIIEGEDFMKTLFRVWFGEKPFSKGLKNGLLGR